MATLLDAVGPVVAISPPGTKLPPLGAARITLDNDNWQSQVEEWASQARAIVLGATPGEVRAGFLWELELVARHLDTVPVIVVVAPFRKRELTRRLHTFLGASWAWTYPLDRASGGMMVACHLPHLGWRAFGARRRTDLGYAVAVRECLAWMEAETALPARRPQ